MHGSIWELTTEDIIRACGLPVAYILNWLISTVFGFDVCEAERTNAYMEYMEKAREQMKKEF